MLLSLALFESFCAFPQQVNEVWRRWMLDALLSLLGSLGCLWIGFSECLHVGVVFFPSLPFMGVMLFPSSWLGNASREWGLVRPSPPTPHSLFLLSLSSVPIFFSSSPPSCLLFIMSFSFVSLPLLLFFFFFSNQQLSLPAHQPFSLPAHQPFSLPAHQPFSSF